ncbi:rap1 GTPase-GDP dissociation stimulator 1 isoform X1 [Siniperca chuatsi]|uniref:rap1 GTPase-GDP dissociation stimulator 1 isoform X1 n=1 Tax=Siniperca chuatsi TaxID=119488 RepID=UPI001CE0A150|nr:rap1 GTPase-GDP dissociation stimulator 1 isoform X1 [Siniperca chuatsi]
MYAYTCSHRDKRRSCRLQPYTPNDNLNNALGAIRVLGFELIEDELKPHLNTVLTNIKERNKGAAEQVVISGILPILALSLRSRGPLTLLTAKLVAELAKESVVRKGFGDAGLVPALLSVLTSKDQELLLHATRAISRISYDSSKLQELFLRRGAVPRLVAILLRFPDKEALEEVCLQALCNISGMGVAEEAGMVWERGASVRPGESVFHGVSPHTCGFASSVTLVCVSQWAPGQYAVNIEVFQRCSSSFWNLHGNKRTARWFPFSSLGRCSNLYKVIKFSTRNVPRTKSLKARMFHTFL